MDDAREIERLRKDISRARSMAKSLLAIEDADWTDWELNFLDTIAGRSAKDDLSYRQAESLLEIQDKARVFRQVSTFSISVLIDNCHLGRMDLDEQNAEFIERLHQDRPSALRRRAAGRLIACAKQLDLIEGYVELA